MSVTVSMIQKDMDSTREVQYTKDHAEIVHNYTDTKKLHQYKR